MMYKKVKFRTDRKRKKFVKKTHMLFWLRFHRFDLHHGGIMAKIYSRRTFDFRFWIYLAGKCAKFNFFKFWRYSIRTNRRHERCWIICKSQCFYLIEFISGENSKMASRNRAIWDENWNPQKNVCVTSNNVKNKFIKIAFSLKINQNEWMSTWLNRKNWQLKNNLNDCTKTSAI